MSKENILKNFNANFHRLILLQQKWYWMFLGFFSLFFENNWIVKIKNAEKCWNVIVIFCAIWYHLYNLKNVKNTHEGVLLLIKLQEFSLLAFSLELY